MIKLKEIEREKEDKNKKIIIGWAKKTTRVNEGKFDNTILKVASSAIAAFYDTNEEIPSYYLSNLIEEVLKDYIMPPTTNLGHMSIAKWRLIADLYSIQQSKFDEVKAGFIYKYQEPEAMQLSWMLIAAILVSIISIPLYIRLIFSKK